jgi:hypothetical protein
MEVQGKKSGLFETVRRELLLRNYSPKTTKAYLSCLRSFVKYITQKHPRDVDKNVMCHAAVPFHNINLSPTLT